MKKCSACGRDSHTASQMIDCLDRAVAELREEVCRLQDDKNDLVRKVWGSGEVGVETLTMEG